MKQILASCFMMLFLLEAAYSLNRIEVKGNLLFDSVTKQQFWVKGVDYQPKNANGMNYDVLADFATIQRDLPYLQQLGINAIRVYEVNTDGNHDQSMAALEQAGIYVILDVPNPEPGKSIEQLTPAWNLDLWRLFKAKVDAFSSYPNLLAFIASNEVSNQVSNTDASAFVKGAVRDLKTYLKSVGKNIPVGYAIADDGSIVLAQQEYFACGTADERPDFYGINIYRWCGDSNYELSGYKNLVDQFTNWPIPVIFSEYGCNTVSPRIFTEVPAIYGSNMTGVFSGGLVYEYSQEVNNYGLVDVVDTTTVTVRADFTNFKTQLATVSPQGASTLDNYNPSLKTVDCPTVDWATWRASNTLPPAVDEQTCACALAKTECRAKATATADLDGNEVAIIYSTVCAYDPTICDQIATNATTGVYGQFSMCDGVTRVSVVMNAYYAALGKDATACDWEGFGQVTTPNDDCTIPSNTNQSSGSSSSSSSNGGASSGNSSNSGSSANTSASSGSQTRTTATEVEITDDQEGSAVSKGVSLLLLAASLALFC